MRLFRIRTPLLLAVGILILWSLPLHASSELLPAVAAKRTLSLADLEQLALQNNPTIGQAVAGIRSAEGQKLQAGLYPNPIIGYEGDEISVSDPSERGLHSAFLEQRLVTAGKLRLSREVFQKEQTQAEVGLEAQKRRVLASVSQAYYQALGAQENVKLQRELSRIAGEAVDTSYQLYNVGQADRPDVLEAEVAAQKAQLDLVAAENRLKTAWAALVSVIGKPDLPLTPLSGALDKQVPSLDRALIKQKLLNDSPQIKIAEVEVERAEAALRRAEAGRFPDVTVRAGYTYNLEPDESEILLGMAVPLPVFDRNQGNIASARASLDRAREELRRLKLALEADMEAAFNAYLNALDARNKYQTLMLPRATEAYELYLNRYKQVAAAYPQVLIAQRTLFQARSDYLQSLIDLWQNIARIEGLLLTGALNEQ